MIIEDVFTSIIASDNLPQIDNTALVSYAKEHIFTSDNYQYDKTEQSDFLDVTHPCVTELIKEIEARCNRIHLMVGLNPTYKHTVVDAWANLNSPFATAVPHQHAQRAFTAVYYASADEDSGLIRFMSPVSSKEQVILPKHVNVHNKFTASGWDFQPKPGLLLIFPSWLYHYALPSKGTTERISFAFNTVFEEHR
jgi:uncharacterized protein (TIGR02466 family)